MRKTIKWMLAATLMLPLNIYAQDGSTPPVTKKPKGIMKLAKKVASTIDSMTVKGLDRNYIDAPEKPWQVIVQGNLSQSHLRMKAVIDGNELFEESFGDITWKPHIKTKLSSYVGVWAGYRGYGIGYSKMVGGDNGSFLEAGAIGGSYGVNLKIHHFKSNAPSVRMYGFMAGEWEDYTWEYPLIDDIRVRTLFFDAYYMFNGKRFSYAAAYDQSVIQKRSAGSFMAGMMYFHSKVAYNNTDDPDFIMFMNDVGRMKQDQASVGAGYAYNLVPCKGLLVSTMAMPMVTFYNRYRAWKYNSNFRECMVELRKNPDMEVPEIDEPIEIWETGKVNQHGRITLNFDAKLSLTYNVGDWFLSAFGQFNTFSYRHGTSKGRFNDWYVNASMGVRL